jgi:hypothetical protein
VASGSWAAHVRVCEIMSRYETPGRGDRRRRMVVLPTLFQSASNRWGVSRRAASCSSEMVRPFGYVARSSSHRTRRPVAVRVAPIRLTITARLTSGGPPPVAADVRKEPMLDRVPLARPLGEAAGRDRQARAIGQLLQLPLPQLESGRPGSGPRRSPRWWCEVKYRRSEEVQAGGHRAAAPNRDDGNGGR